MKTIIVRTIQAFIVIFFIATVITLFLSAPNRDEPALAVVVLLIGMFLIPVLLAVIENCNTDVTNSSFIQKYETTINVKNDEITLCSINHDNPRKGSIRIVSDNATTVIRRDTNITIPFSTITNIGLIQSVRTKDTATLSCYKIITEKENQFDGHHYTTSNVTKEVEIAKIIFPIEHINVAEIIRDRMARYVELKE